MIQAPRGTRDFVPDEMAYRRWAEQIMRRNAELFGYGEVSTPTFESLELFTLKSGPGIIDEIYAFEDKGGRELALRPELTAPVMRMVINEMRSRPKPIKLFYFGNCFRYDRPQSGRYREFYQFGFEVVGAGTPAADAEIIALAIKNIKDLGLEGFRVKIGHIGVIRSVISDLSKEEQARVMQALDKEDYELVRSLVPDETAERLLQITCLNGDVSVLDGIGEGAAHLREIMRHLSYYGFEEHCTIDMSVVRGLDYYTGMVFEIEAPILGAEKQICGGGAYSLIKLLGGGDVPSTGFAIGFDRVLLALEKEGKRPKISEKILYLIRAGSVPYEDMVRLAARLRLFGVSVDFPLYDRSLSKGMKYASAMNYPYVAIMGEEEWRMDMLTIRDMETGEQQQISVEQLIARFS